MRKHAVFGHIALLALALALLAGALGPTGASAAVAGRAHPPRRDSFAQVIAWAPHGFGTITIRRGHSAVRTVEFTNLYPLRDVHIDHAVSPAEGVRMRILSTTLPPSRRLKHDFHVVRVRFVVYAGADADLGRYAASLHVDAVVQGHEGFRPLLNDFDFAVRVVRNPHHPPVPHPTPAVIRWTPSNSFGVVTVQRGQVLTETATFTSSVALTGVQVRRILSDYARDRGVAVHVVSTSLSPTNAPASLPANTAVSVTFTVAAGLYARPNVYPALLVVVGAPAGQARPRVLHYALHIRVDVDRIAAAIYWTPASLGVITLRQGQTVTETATFTSSVDLTNVALAHALSDYARDRGVSIAIVSPAPATLATLAAGTPVNVTFTITAGPHAGVHTYPAYLVVKGSIPGSPYVVRLPRTLPFVVDVDRAIVVTPGIVWAGGSYVSYPPIAAGASANETASFTSSVALSNVQIVARLTTRAAGLKITVAPLASTTIAADTPTSVSFTIDATGVPAKFKGALYSGLVYLIGQPPTADRPVVLHSGLHFDGAVG